MSTLDSRQPEKLKVAYYPPGAGTNAYNQRIKDILGKDYEVCDFPNKTEIAQHIKKMFSKQFDCSVVNWIENLTIDSNGNVTARALIRTVAWIALIKLISKKTIYIKHNHYPHRTADNQKIKAARLTNWIANCFDYILCHSLPDTPSNAQYCHHPLYITGKPTKEEIERLEQKWKGNQEKDYYILFGRIEPYKNIVPLIKAFPADKRLLIVGPAKDSHYSSEIWRIKPKHIDYHPGYLSEEEAEFLVTRSRGLILSSEEKSVIVSGSAIFALSHRVNLFAISSPFTSWLANVAPGQVRTSKDIAELASSIAQHTLTEMTSRETNWREVLADEKIRATFKRAIESN